jgi:hypothetical protein
MLVIFVAFITGSTVAGFLIGRWWVPAVVFAVALAVLAIGISDAVYGAVPEELQATFFTAAVFGAMTAAAGVAVRKFVRRRAARGGLPVRRPASR